MLARQLVVALIVVHAASVGAYALTAAEYDCQRSIAKAGAKFAKRVHTAELRCSNDTAEGASCDMAALTQAHERAATILGNKLTARCRPPIALGHLGYRGPCADANGPPFTVGELITCIRDSHQALVNGAVLVEYPTGAGPLSGHAFTCQRRIGSSGLRFIAKKLKHRQSCLNDQLRGRLGPAIDCRAEVPPLGPGTGDARTDARIARAIDKLATKLAGACTGVVLEDLGFPGPCPDPDGSPFTLADLQTCMREAHELRADTMLDYQYPSGAPTPTGTPTPTATPTITQTVLAPTASSGETPSPAPTDSATATPFPTPTAG